MEGENRTAPFDALSVARAGDVVRRRGKPEHGTQNTERRRKGRGERAEGGGSGGGEGERGGGGEK